MPERSCPDCNEILTGARFGPVDLDLCPVCGGVWFDCGELSHVITGGPDVVRRLAARLPSGSKRKSEQTRPLGPPPCPACRAPLSSIEYASMPGVRLDACRFCEGFWVPRTKLTVLAEALAGRTMWTQVIMDQAADAGRAAPTLPPVAKPKPAPKKPKEPTPPPAPTVPCGECGEANADNAATCWACGKSMRGVLLANCPRCEAVMRTMKSGTVTLSACEGCGGAYLSPNKLNALLLQEPEAQKKLLRDIGRFQVDRIKQLHVEPECPHCSVLMLLSPMGRISQQPVPTCPRCFGLLLDHGTLTDILLR